MRNIGFYIVSPIGKVLVNIGSILYIYDVKVKSYPMALSLVKLHKQPKGLAQLRRRCYVPCTWPPIFSGPSTAASEGRARTCPKRLCNLTRRCSLNHLLTSTSYLFYDKLFGLTFFATNDHFIMTDISNWSCEKNMKIEGFKAGNNQEIFFFI